MSESKEDANPSQEHLLRDLHSPVQLVQKYALNDLSNVGDRHAHLAILQFIETVDSNSELHKAAKSALSAIEERLGLTRSLGPLPTASGRFEKPDLSEPPPPLIPKDPGDESSDDQVMVVDEFQQINRARLIEEALANVDKVVEPRTYGYRVEVPLLNGRRQFVRVAYEQSDFENDKVIVIYTMCGPANPAYFAWALDLNRKLDHGKLAVGRDSSGEPSFWLMQTLVERTASRPELRKAILTVAEKGDRIESLLSDQDVH